MVFRIKRNSKEKSTIHGMPCGTHKSVEVGIGDE